MSTGHSTETLSRLYIELGNMLSLKTRSSREVALLARLEDMVRHYEQLSRDCGCGEATLDGAEDLAKAERLLELYAE